MGAMALFAGRGKEKCGYFMENNNNSNLKEIIWQHVEEEIQNVITKFPNNFEYNEKGKALFEKYFDRYIDYIKDKVMQSEVSELDSHKVAAVIICSVIQANALNISAYEYNAKQMIFDGNEKVAVKVGLGYMAAALKKIMEGTKEEKKFTEYIMPKALMCETDYMTIICRNLYYAKTYYELNPIDLANTLFLLEQLTLLQEQVDFEILRKAVQEKCH